MSAARILIVGGDATARAGVLALLGRAGFANATSADSVRLESSADVPELIVVTGGGDIPAIVTDARATPLLAEIPILAVCPQVPAEAAVAAIAAGATDVIREPREPGLIGARLRSMLRHAESLRSARQLTSLQAAHGEVCALLARGEGPEVLREALMIVGEALEFERISLVAHIEGSHHAYVIAATDDPGLGRFAINVANYPEIVSAMSGDSVLAIADTATHPLTEPIASTLLECHVRAQAIFPIRWRGGSLGVLFCRKSTPGVDSLTSERVAFARQVAAVLAATLSHSYVLNSLREQTQRISRARYESERRLRTIASLKEHFEAAADGVLILDDAGHILFVNRTAERITGFAHDGLIGSSLVDLVPSAQHELVLGAIQAVLVGHNVEPFDLDLATTTGDEVCVSVSTSTVLGAGGAAILSFRDVTAERALEEELRKTKDFLERLIDSTVDAIISADLDGNVILFNLGAERLFGYQVEEVIGKIGVRELYAPGVPKQVMRMLRSTSYGGVGRLELTRREIRTRAGELVPVNMTASIIYEHGRELATVGIFTDLRERIRIEQRLLRAQQQLQQSEKQALVAELAGAAAHELNQPLTSILGYAQLIQRQSDPDAAYLRALDIIVNEGERMAEIVKKIGRITKFETKEYVGSANILDLDRSTDRDYGGGDADESAQRSSARHQSASDDATHDDYITLDHLELGDMLALDVSADPATGRLSIVAEAIEDGSTGVSSVTDQAPRAGKYPPDEDEDDDRRTT